jgi:hypothetical protein
MSAQTLRFALTEGVMQAQGGLVPKDKLGDLIGYLAATEPAGGDWVAAMMCKPDQRTVDLEQPVSLSMFGVDINNSRFMPAEQAGLSSADMKSLEPRAPAQRDVPSLIPGHRLDDVSMATPNAALALDTKTACEMGRRRRAAAIGGFWQLGNTGRKALIFADGRAQVMRSSGPRSSGANGRHVHRADHRCAVLKDRVIVPVRFGVGSARIETRMLRAAPSSWPQCRHSESHDAHDGRCTLNRK